MLKTTQILNENIGYFIGPKQCEAFFRYGGDGSVYVGSFRYGRSSGQGVMTYRSGETIVGEFLDMKPHGRVVYEAATSDTDSIPHGDSTLTDKNAPLTVKGTFSESLTNKLILHASL